VKLQPRELPVLLVDCQTTGANPEKGALLELAWATSTASTPVPGSSAIEVRLVTLPNGKRIPPAITRITGITQDELDASAVPRETAWKDLCRTLAEVTADATPAPGIRTVAHFARFEEQFLRHLAEEISGEEAFPLHFLCTHEISKRLLPDLPRRGLHALAGYFGSPLSEHKQAREHLEATAMVWHGLVRLLDEDHDVRTLADLDGFLKQPPPRRGTRWSFPLPRERRLALHEVPGVYRFLSASGDVLYVGKATSLRTRVNSYYRKRKAKDRLLELVSQAQDVDVTATDSSLEAALLEVDEIKRLDPPYNRALKDRGQALWYFSDNYANTSPQPSADCPHGPLPQGDAGEQLQTLCKTLGRPTARWEDEDSLRQSLGLQRIQMEPGALHEALRVLGDEWTHPTAGAPTADQLLRCGHALWHGHLASLRARQEEESDPLDDEEAQDEMPQPQPLNAQEVHRIVESIPMMIAHHLRRGRWLSRLSNAGFWWSRPQEGGTGGRGIVLRSGIIRVQADAGNLAELREVADEASLAGRMKPDTISEPDAESFRLVDFACYERLRVLNSEIRRLVQQGRDLRIWMRPERILDGRHLRRILPWV